MIDPKKYPDGKLTNDDEGNIQIKLGFFKDRFIIEFGKPIKWLGLTKKEAEHFAKSILQVLEDE